MTLWESPVCAFVPVKSRHPCNVVRSFHGDVITQTDTRQPSQSETINNAGHSLTPCVHFISCYFLKAIEFVTARIPRLFCCIGLTGPLGPGPHTFRPVAENVYERHYAA